MAAFGLHRVRHRSLDALIPAWRLAATDYSLPYAAAIRKRNIDAEAT